MGTVLELRVVAADKAEAARIAEQAAQLVTHWDDVLTTWRSAGQLYRFNQLAGKGSQPVSPDLAAALATMTRLSADTGGAFDPAVGPLVDHWRLDKAASHPTPARAPQPTPALRIATALELDGDSARLLADAAIDAGGIGKGLALDAATELLRGLGALAPEERRIAGAGGRRIQDGKNALYHIVHKGKVTPHIAIVE